MAQLTIILFALLTIGSCCAAAFDLSLDGLWASYKIRYAKQYSTETDDMHRLLTNIDKDCLVPRDQIRCLITYSSPAEYFPTKLPTSVDWRKKDYITPVMDQSMPNTVMSQIPVCLFLGECGDCWAFSPLEALEGQHKAVSGKLVKLSVANLVECVPESQGCLGGYVASAYTYMITHGIDTAACYLDGEITVPCRYNKTCIGATMKGVANIKSGSEHKLHYSTAKIGPISVEIDASSSSFQEIDSYGIRGSINPNKAKCGWSVYRDGRGIAKTGKSYTSGVYDDPHCSSTHVDHAVLVVAYGVKDGKDFWIVKNSWGTEWGMKGYILMSRNKKNQCGIASYATYPTDCCI